MMRLMFMLLLCCGHMSAEQQFESDLFADEIDKMFQGDFAKEDYVGALLNKRSYSKTKSHNFEHAQKNSLLHLVSLRSRKQCGIKAQFILRLMQKLRRLLEQSKVAA